MANVKFPRSEFEKYIKITPEIEEKISLFGTPIESLSEKEIEIEVFPNRPDLLSMHGFLRGFLGFLGKKTGLKTYKVHKPELDYTVTIDKSVLEVRPYTACAIIKGMKFDDEKIKEIIDIQEKIHGTFGRNRKKIAIGIYPLEKIQLPIKFLAKNPNEIKFQPLETNREMTGRQILSAHPAGRDYAHLLEGKKEFPIFIDDNDEVLSMPPIINSDKTGRISEKTKDIFIECSGFDFPSLSKTLNILVTTFADMGGKIYQMNLKHPKGSKITPDLTPSETKISLENTNKLLGLELSEKELRTNLEKMGHEYSKDTVKTPAWRTDILHENDLIEDVAIAYGYNNFIPEIPNISSEGGEDPNEIKKRKISEILIGLNLLEISNYHLTTTKDQFKNLNIKPENPIEVEDSKTEYNLLRQNLLHYSLKILSENTDSEYPQRIFEIGKTFSLNESTESGISEEDRLAIALASPTSNFTEIKQVFDYLARSLGLDYKIKQSENPFFIEGRCGEIHINDKIIGYLGEISPKILNNLKIKMPICALEINLKELI